MPTPTPTPSLTPLPTSVPTPAPSPSVLHVVMDGGAPVWQGPLYTGLFVLGAALLTAGIAFLSLWLSDRRKLRREDQRQWDSDLKKAYVTIAGQTTEVYRAIVLMRSDPPTKLGEVTLAAMETVQEQALLLELLAPKAVHEVAQALANVLVEIYMAAFKGERKEPPTEAWRTDMTNRLNALEKQLRVETRRAIRMPQH